MAFTAVCAAGGGAPIAPHHGFLTFDYDQQNHNVFVAVVGPGGPTGCCLALTMEWFRNWLGARQGYEAYVNSAPAGLIIAPNIAAFFAAGAAWPGVCDIQMGGIGGGMAVVPPGGNVPGPALVGAPAGAAPAIAAAAAAIAAAPNAVALTAVAVASRCTILVAAGAAGSHAVGILRAGNAVYFFDPNHGEVFFPAAADFGNWFFGGYAATCLTPVVGAPFTLSRLRYN